MHLGVDAHGVAIRVTITEGTQANYQTAGSLTDGLSAEYLLVDKDYDSDSMLSKQHGEL